MELQYREGSVMVQYSIQGVLPRVLIKIYKISTLNRQRLEGLNWIAAPRIRCWTDGKRKWSDPPSTIMSFGLKDLQSTWE